MQTNIPSVLRQLRWAGKQCQKLMETMFRGLTLDHLEVDEIWTFVQKKQGRLTPEEKAERGNIGDVYLWYGIDQKTKLVPTFLLAKRSGDAARRFMVKLANTLKMPNPHESDNHHYMIGSLDTITQISTDGYQGYPEAVDLAFGRFAKFGVIKKDYRNVDMPGRYSPGEIVGTDRRAVYCMREDELSTICTSHIERHNLTIRTFMKRFTRLALGFSKKYENLEAAVALHMAYYNFCWRPGKMRITPAMAAKVTDHFWTFGKLMEKLSEIF
jgi:IS1 family transposase